MSERGELGRMIMALAAGDRAASVKQARKMGFRTQRNNPQILFRLVQLCFDRDDPESMTLPDGKVPPNVQLYFEELGKLDPVVEMPPAFVMVARNSFLLRGLGTHFGLQVRAAKLWKELARVAITRAEEAEAEEAAAAEAEKTSEETEEY